MDEVPQELERTLSPGELAEKARRLLEEGEIEFEASREAEEELGIRRRASVACEKAFHALVALSDAVIERQVETHGQRIKALRDLNQNELADLYHIAKDALHTECFYGQQVGREQAQVLDRVREAVLRESEKLR